MSASTPFGVVLVVGGCGFLGHHLVEEVVKRDGQQTKIAVMDVNTERNRHPAATYYAADVTARDQIQKVLEEVKPRVIFHTVSPSPFEKDRNLLEKVNVTGTQHLIDCAKAVGTVKAFVYTCSSSIIHNQRDPMVDATEELPVLYYPEQSEYYSHTKALAEDIVLGANRSGGNMLTVSIRPATLNGPGDMIITKTLAEQALTGRAKYHFGDGKNLFDICYVKNCTDAQFLAAQALIDASTAEPLPQDKRVEGEAFLVSNDEHVPFWDLQRIAAEIAQCPVKPGEIQAIPRWFMMAGAFVGEWGYWISTQGKQQPPVTRYIVNITTMERTVCIDKIKTRLGYRPRFNTREGLQKGITWYLETHAKSRAPPQQRN
ncbi:hydroxysteroid dehydrogenase [Massariosphaeria phaeospora]|uniref:Hydroxysteroid dehydrogenase n=1 Tax=Massariosphaeria phaeospora TaxID=100035 RepID=A0A7C8I336_9PLEO|nr:hydroxysteroid dehydrogenase [Massariosphaeria phaeospora]